MRPDIVIEIEAHMDDPSKDVIKTNATRKGLEEILGEWLRNQMGQGKDAEPPNIKSVYRITIGLELGSDDFATESDTGNKSLTCGIVRDAYTRLGQITVKPLE